MSEDNTFNDSHNIIWDKSTLNSISGNYVWIIGGSFIKWNPDYFTALDITVDYDKSKSIKQMEQTLRAKV